VLTALGAGLVLAMPVHAQTVWSGATSADWNTGTNWSSGVPTNTTAAVFGASSNYGLTFSSAGAALGLTFNTGGSAYSFANNAYVLSIYGSGITNNTTNTEIFNAPVTAAATQTWNNTSTGGLTFSNVTLLAGPMGGITLTLSGASNLSVTGTLTNSGGNNTLTNNSTGTVSLTNINLSEGNTGRTLTISGSGNTTVTGVIADGGTSAGSLNIGSSGPMGGSGSRTVTLSGANTYTGATNINAGILNIQSAGAMGTAANTSNTTVANGAVLQVANNITTTNKGTLILNGSGTGSGALQSVSGNNTWNGSVALASDATIFSATAGNTLFLDDNYVSAQTLTMGNHTLTVDGPGDTWFNANVGVAGDTGGFVKNGTGKATFYGYNTFYTGATVVNAGSLDLIVGPFTAGWYVINGALTIGTGPANPALAGTVNVNIASNSYPNQISPTSAVTINSDGALNVGAATSLGSLTLNGGRVNLTVALTPTGSITANANSAHQTSLISGGQLTLAGSTTFDVARDATNASDLTVSSVVGGGALVKQGAGVLTLTGANTYTGATNINAGVLNIQNATALGTAAGGTTVASGAALQTQGGITVTGEALTLNGTGTSNDGALRNISGNNTWTGGVTLGSASRINSDAGTLTLSGNIGGNTQNLTVGGAGNTAISGVIGTTTGSLTKDGAGTLTLSGANTYTGATNINQGTLALGATNALSSSTAVTVSSSATLNLNSFSDSVGSIAGAGNVTLGSGTLTTGADGTSTTFSGVISGSGNLTKTGTGTLTLAGANTHTGATNINAGTLQLGANNALSSSTAVTVAGGATLNLNNYSDTIGSLAGAGVITLGSGTLTAGADNTSTIFSGSFTGGNTGTFAKTGSGTLTFGAAMNLSAGTLVLNGGTLNLGNFNSTFGSLSVTADSILDFSASGSSILHLNSLTVNSGVTLTIQNWTDTVDYFYSLNNPGAGNLGRIVFTGFTGADTTWQSYDSQIKPVPEPATYGALLLGLSTLYAGWRLYRRRTL
jgi:fibronectin-binding autotransporter adhesin